MIFVQAAEGIEVLQEIPKEPIEVYNKPRRRRNSGEKREKEEEKDEEAKATKIAKINLRKRVRAGRINERGDEEIRWSWGWVQHVTKWDDDNMEVIVRCTQTFHGEKVFSMGIDEDVKKEADSFVVLEKRNGKWGPWEVQVLRVCSAFRDAFQFVCG